MRKLLCTVVAACICAVWAAYIFAQTPVEKKEFAPLSPIGKEIVAEKKDAPSEYQNVIDIIKTGNEAKAKGDDASAYCLYGEALYKLNDLADKFPNWKKDMVAKQIKNIKDVSTQLTSVTCKNLEEMKESQFRLEVWQRQVLTLDKLDKIEKMLNGYDRAYWNQWDQWLRDIRAILQDRRR